MALVKSAFLSLPFHGWDQGRPSLNPLDPNWAFLTRQFLVVASQERTKNRLQLETAIIADLVLERKTIPYVSGVIIWYD